MNTAIISQRVSSVAPTYQSSTDSGGPWSYQPTAKKTSSAIIKVQNGHEEDEIVLDLIEECERLTRDFNVKVALYRETLRQLGDVGDGVIVRRETQQQRHKGMEAAKVAAMALSTHVKSNGMGREAIDRLFVQLTGCMEHFVMEMRKGIFLVQKFPCDIFLEPDLSALPGMILSDSDSKFSTAVNVPSNCSHNSQTKSCLSANRRERDQSADTDIFSTMSHPHEVKGIARDIQEIETLLRDITCTDMVVTQDKYADGTPTMLSEMFQPSTSLNKFRRRLGSCCCLCSL